MPNVQELIAQGNHYRSIPDPVNALACYAQAFLQEPKLGAAYNNYGNVIREMGFPEQAYGFLNNAIDIDPNDSVANFNLAVAYLLAGDLKRGWPQYEKRWSFEHLAGTLPNLPKPRWDGMQDINGKTILITGEQGHGDSIQFVRFVRQLEKLGATCMVVCDLAVAPLFRANFSPRHIIKDLNEPLLDTDHYDFWTPIMTIPMLLGIDDYSKLPQELQYLYATKDSQDRWAKRLGPKTKLRVGFCWSGRPDTWINQHKAMPFEKMLAFIQRNPEYEWINLQVGCTLEQEAELVKNGVKAYPGTISNFDDTAGLMMHCDVVIAVDTSVGHLAGALGRPWWLPLNQFGQDWRYLLVREDSPWYPSCRIYRQPSLGDWDTPIERMHTMLKLFKI